MARIILPAVLMLWLGENGSCGPVARVGRCHFIVVTVAIAWITRWRNTLCLAHYDSRCHWGRTRPRHGVIGGIWKLWPTLVNAPAATSSLHCGIATGLLLALAERLLAAVPSCTMVHGCTPGKEAQFAELLSGHH